MLRQVSNVGTYWAEGILDKSNSSNDGTTEEFFDFDRVTLTWHPGLPAKIFAGPKTFLHPNRVRDRLEVIAQAEDDLGHEFTSLSGEKCQKAIANLFLFSFSDFA